MVATVAITSSVSAIEPYKSISDVETSGYSNSKIKYVNVDTPYGQVNVPEDAFKRLGKDKIIAKTFEFNKQRDEFKKLNEWSGRADLDSFAISDANLTVSALSSFNRQTVNTLRSVPDWMERTEFTMSPQQSPTLLYGCVEPQPISNPDHEYFISYAEREIFLNNFGDAFEVISDQRNEVLNGQSTSVVIVFYDWGDIVGEPILLLRISNVEHPVSTDYYTKVNGIVVYPYTVFNQINNAENVQYVYAKGHVVDGVATCSVHKAGKPDPQ